MSVSVAPRYFPESDPESSKLSARSQIWGGRAKKWICVIGSVLFCLASTTFFLYTSNQNTKFLHGLAKAFPERLGADWTAGTVDGLPVFSALVFTIAGFGHPVLFYVLEFGLLACLFLSSFLLMLRLAGDAGRSVYFQLACAGSLVLLVQANRPFLFLDGVAGQYLVGGYLQPSEFGVLFVASFTLALAGFRKSAIVIAAVPAALHAGYAMLSVIVVGSMLLSDGSLRRDLSVKFFAILLIVVPQVDLALRFAPTDYATFREATSILAFERIPLHSDPARWLGKEAYAKLTLAFVGTWLAPRGVLRTALAALLVWAIVGALIVASTGIANLALVAPWRASIILVPVSTLIVFARLGKLFFESPLLRRGSATGSAVLVVLAISVAGKGALTKFTDYRERRSPEYVAFIQGNHKPDDIYLTNPFNERFRLDAMSAQFVTWKTHPYRDTEVLEWYRRVMLAREVFGDQNGKEPLNCTALAGLASLYPVTHILVEGREMPADEMCPPLEMVFSSGGAKIFKINRSL